MVWSQPLAKVHLAHISLATCWEKQNEMPMARHWASSWDKTHQGEWDSWDFLSQHSIKFCDAIYSKSWHGRTVSIEKKFRNVCWYLMLMCATSHLKPRWTTWSSTRCKSDRTCDSSSKGDLRVVIGHEWAVIAVLVIRRHTKTRKSASYRNGYQCNADASAVCWITLYKSGSWVEKTFDKRSFNSLQP